MDITLGEIIAQKRKEMHLTQTQLAERFGISDKAVSKWERNLSKPDVKFIPELVELLGLPCEYLPKQNTEYKHISAFREIIVKELLRIFCVGVILASVICFSLGFLSVESTVILYGCGVAGFAFITILKSP